MSDEDWHNEENRFVAILLCGDAGEVFGDDNRRSALRTLKTTWQFSMSTHVSQPMRTRLSCDTTGLPESARVQHTDSTLVYLKSV